MFYHFLSKTLSPLLDPGSFLLLLLIVGVVLLWTRWSAAGRWLAAMAVAGFGIVAVLPLGNWLLAPLENRFSGVHEKFDRVDGIIVLGGATNSFLSLARDQVALNGNAERLTGFLSLARNYPQARLVFSGGSSALKGSVVSEAELAERLFRELGFETANIHFERQARNTWENANKTLNVLKPGEGETWLLVTSARHMPRAMGVFHKVGWPVKAWPVDYKTAGPVGYGLRFNLRAGLSGLSEGLREWAALFVYRFLDRTDQIFPAP
jgi:uncharacterized SAM-binding protein YcdF (DUF218 family)